MPVSAENLEMLQMALMDFGMHGYHVSRKVLMDMPQADIDMHVGALLDARQAVHDALAACAADLGRALPDA